MRARLAFILLSLALSGSTSAPAPVAYSGGGEPAWLRDISDPPAPNTVRVYFYIDAAAPANIKTDQKLTQAEISGPSECENKEAKAEMRAAK